MKHITCEGGDYFLSGMVADDADLDGRFTMICDDTGETLRVNGWMFIIEVID